jgi:hypothetical protein
MLPRGFWRQTFAAFLSLESFARPEWPLRPITSYNAFDRERRLSSMDWTFRAVNFKQRQCLLMTAKRLSGSGCSFDPKRTFIYFQAASFVHRTGSRRMRLRYGGYLTCPGAVAESEGLARGKHPPHAAYSAS